MFICDMHSPTIFARSSDLLHLLLPLLNWQDLMILAQTNAFLRGEVGNFIQKYIATLLDPFIPYKDQNAFWTMMDTTQSVLCGDFIMTILLCIPRQDIMGDICDVITPNGQLDAVIRSLNSFGYRQATAEEIGLEVESAVSCRRVVFLLKISLEPVRTILFIQNGY